MSLFRRREARADSPTNDLGELYARRRDPAPGAGVSVTPESAKRMSAVWACVDLIAGLGSTLPLDEFLWVDGKRTEQKRPPVFMSPDGELGLTGWLYQVFESLLTTGNAYGLILERDQAGWPTKIQIVPPSTVQVSQRGAPYGPFQFTLNGKPIRRYDRYSGTGDLWHTPAYLTAGTIIGMSPITYAAMSIGTNLAAQEFGGRWFRDGATPTAVLSHDKDANRETASLLKQRWMDTMRGNREPVVLAGGWKYEPVRVSPNESQFLETIRASVADVARFFRVPPSEIGAVVDGSSMTYSNTEQRALALLTYTLNPWLVRLEESLSGLRPPGRYVKFNVDALLRTELTVRYKAHDQALRAGWRSVNEVRALEDLEPLVDGDRTVWPPWRMQLTQEEMGTGETIDGPIDDSTQGGQSA